MEPTPPPPLARSTRRRRWPVRLWLTAAVLSVAGVALAVAAGTEVALRVGPTRAAWLTGKRVARGLDYRISYAYDDGGRAASDTDHVTREFFFGTHLASPLRVRTFGVGTFRFARLAGASRPADRRAAVGRWAGVGSAAGLLAAVRLSRARRRAAARAGGPATRTGAPPGP